MKPFGIISDTHHHNWSAFATMTPSGVNSRLWQILDETYRCADEVQKAGGDTIYHGGDLFHVRGSIAPSVLVPTLDVYKSIIERGVKIIINAGNHDLEGKEADRVSSAITALEGIGCTVINRPDILRFDPAAGNGPGMYVIPWIPDIAELKSFLDEVLSPSERKDLDVLLHAPIDGVISGLPDHGLTDAYLAGLGYRRVFAGHYHHHKDFGNGVYSIGSLTPQTWSDIGAKSGFLIVSDAGVKWFASHAPSFVEINGATDPDEIPLIVDGNYVRVTINSSKAADVEAMRSFLTDCGAKGVVVLQDTKAVPVTARAGGVTLKAGATLEQSIGDFIAAQAFKRQADLAKLCGEILTNVRSVA